jgi:hypothetical protein
LAALTALEKDALTELQAVVRVGAAGAESEFVDRKTVLGDSDALASDAPLRRAANGGLGAVTRVIEVETSLALVAVSRYQIVGFAIPFRIIAPSEAESLPFAAARERTVGLNAAAVGVDSLIGLFATETVARNRVVGGAVGRNIDAEQTEAGGDLAAGTNHAFADSVFGVITASAAEADSADSVEIIALGGDCEAGETDGVLSGGALDHNGNAGAVGGDLEERIVASETLSS